MPEHLILVLYLAIPIAIAVNFCVAEKFDDIAVMKGYPKNSYIWWCFFTGIAGWLMVLALPERASEEEKQTSGENADAEQERETEK